VPLLTR